MTESSFFFCHNNIWLQKVKGKRPGLGIDETVPLKISQDTLLLKSHSIPECKPDIIASGSLSSSQLKFFPYWFSKAMQVRSFRISMDSKSYCTVQSAQTFHSQHGIGISEMMVDQMNTQREWNETDLRLLLTFSLTGSSIPCY